MKLFRVFYEETLSYEDYIEAKDVEQAKVIFATTLLSDDGNGIEPMDTEVVEFEAEEVNEYNSPMIMS